MPTLPPHMIDEDPDGSRLRKPPHSLTAEETVVSALLQWNDCIDACAALEPEHFFSAQLRRVYTEARRQILNHKPTDAMTVYEALRDGDNPDLLTYIGQVATAATNSRSVQQLAGRIVAHAVERKIITTADNLAANAFKGDGDPMRHIGSAMNELQTLAIGATKREPIFVDESLPAYIDMIERRSTGDEIFFPTGLVDFDKKLAGGIRPGQLVVIGARPSMGKTTLAMTILMHAIEARAEYAGLICSQEMPRSQIIDSRVATLGHIDLDRVRRPDPHDADAWTRIAEGADRLSKMNLLIDDQPGLTLADVQAKVIMAKRKARGKLGLVVVDFLQLMKGEGENRNAQLDPIVNGLKEITLEHGIGMLLLSQCNRAADQKPEGADSMSDLRDSGAIEAAADVVALVHREFVRTENPALQHYGQLRVVKQRFGPIGRVNLYFDGPHQFFGNWTGPAPITHSGGTRRTHSNGED